MLSTIFSGSDDLIVILVAVVVLFGGKQLPKLAKNTGEALREFRKARTDAEAGNSAATPPATAMPAAPDAAPVLPAAAPGVPVAAAVSAVNQASAPEPGDSVTLTRSQLDALLADRAASAQAEGPKAGS
jgi:sec-independent protein translocase protein TatA